MSVFTGLRTVSVPVENQQQSLDFYLDKLGFTVARDADTPNGRWIELIPGGGDVVVTLQPARPGLVRGDILARFSTADAESAWNHLTSTGVDADEILRWPGVPPMFAFRDLDGNAFSVTEV